MKRLFKSHSRVVRSWVVLWLGLTIFCGVFQSLTWLAHAEGSRSLYPAGATGHRANIEWRNSFYGDFFRRRSLFQVYVEQGEVILLGSSAMGVDNGDIRIYDPGRVTGPIGDETIPALPDFSCAAQRGTTTNPDQGRITSRAEELAGPDTITDPVTAAPGNDILNSFIPCFYTATVKGIYSVVFLGPTGDNSDVQIAPTGQIDLTSPANFNAQQATSVAAWDVTVRPALTSTVDLNGRLFVDYLTRFTGGWPRPVNATYFVLTRDGYLYQTDLRGLDANGFIVYANDVGFLDSDGSPLYHDVVADPSIPPQEQNQLNVLLGGVSLAPPTSLIFFNPPSAEAITANNIPLSQTVPKLISFEFGGRLGDNDTFVGGGGVFTFTTNISGTYRLVISRDGIDFEPDNPLNWSSRERHASGTQTIVWDGLDISGNSFPAGLNYQAQLIVRGGEHHFPILDAEDSLEGGPTYTLLNPPGGNCPSLNGNPPNCNTGFYDDRGYTTASGIDVGTPGLVLPGNDPPDPSHSDLLTGFDTTTNQRRFGDGSATGFGDAKGLDIWTFFPSEPKLTAIDIFALNVAIGKTDAGVTTTPGGNVVYTLPYSNTGPIDATGVVITDVVPLYSIFNASASAPTEWSCPDASPVGAVCATSIGTLRSGASGSVRFAVTVIDGVPAGITQIENTAVISQDGSRGPEPLFDNTASDTTPLIRPTPPNDDGNGSSPTPTMPPSGLTGTPPPSPTGTPPLPGTTLTPQPETTTSLPVATLPETGTTKRGQNAIIEAILFLLALSGLILVKFYFRRTR